MDVRTAYLVVIDKNGDSTATSDLSIELNMESEATLSDIKSSVTALAKIIDKNDLVEAILDGLRGPAKEDVSGSIRKALEERGIL